MYDTSIIITLTLTSREYHLPYSTKRMRYSVDETRGIAPTNAGSDWHRVTATYIRLARRGLSTIILVSNKW